MVRTVTPLPTIGDVVVGRDIAGRELRISGHPEADRLVLSIWQSGRCLATVRLARADVPEVTRALVAGLVPTSIRSHPYAANGSGRTATVHELPRWVGQNTTSTGDVVRELRVRVNAGLRELRRRLRGVDPRN
jgi:hypothetical protein